MILAGFAEPENECCEVESGLVAAASLSKRVAMARNCLSRLKQRSTMLRAL